MNWNVRGLSRDSHRVLNLKYALQQSNPHVVTLQETFWNEIGIRQVFFANYIIHRTDRTGQHGGGVAILVRRDVKHTRLPNYKLKPFEICTIAVQVQGRTIKISSLYSPTHTATFKQRVAALFTDPDHFVFGDWNARHPAWNGSAVNVAGTQLFDMQLSSGIVVHHPDCHTYQSPTAAATESTIDHIVTNSVLPLGEINRVDCLFSDHWAFSAIIGIPPTQFQRYRMDYKKANWAAFCFAVTEEIRSIEVPNTVAEIDEAIELLTLTIHKACEIAVPKVTEKSRSDDLPDDTLGAIRELRRLKRRWNSHRFHPDEPTIRSQLQCCRILLGQLLKRDRHEQWTKMTKGLNENMTKCWRIARRIRGDSNAMPPLRSVDGNDFVTDFTEKAEIMATEFESYHHPGREPKISDRAVSTKVKSFSDSYQNRAPIFDPITIEEISQVWQRFRPFKCPGIDRVLNITLKKLPIRAKQFIVEVLNKCLELGYWPENWKLAKIICIPKRGKKLDLRSSYRPISLLSGLSKTFERIIADRLEAHASANNIIQSHQFGFRRQHSAVQQAVRLKQHILTARANRQSTGAIFLDVKNAFPSVWIDGLLAKMIKSEFPDYLTLIIRAFCDKRRFFVQVSTAKSSIRTTTNGTPQGSCISPILYSIFIADMHLPKGVTVALFADDTAFFAHSPQARGINTKLRIANKSARRYCDRWRIGLNTSKTEAILFPFDGKKRRKPADNTVHLHDPLPPASDDDVAHDISPDALIEYKSCAKYLGVYFDSKLLFSEHIKRTNAKATGAAMSLYPLLAKSSKLAVKTKLLLFKQIVRPIITYASPVWSGAAKCHLKHLQVTQNRVLKTILKLERRHPTFDVHTRADIPMLDVYLETLNTAFWERCMHSNFELIRALVP